MRRARECGRFERNRVGTRIAKAVGGAALVIIKAYAIMTVA